MKFTKKNTHTQQLHIITCIRLFYLQLGIDIGSTRVAKQQKFCLQNAYFPGFGVSRMRFCAHFKECLEFLYAVIHVQNEFQFQEKINKLQNNFCLFVLFGQ